MLDPMVVVMVAVYHGKTKGSPHDNSAPLLMDLSFTPTEQVLGINCTLIPMTGPEGMGQVGRIPVTPMQ